MSSLRRGWLADNWREENIESGINDELYFEAIADDVYSTTPWTTRLLG